MARVLLADDEPVVRSGIRAILEADGHEIVGEAADGATAVRLGRDLRPDVVLMDVRMPGVDGLGATALLAGPTARPATAVVVLTTFDLDEYVHDALRAGARGFLLKTAGPRLLQEAVRAAAADGDSLISPTVTTRLLAHFAPPPSASGGTGRPDRVAEVGLTAREAEVVAAVARGSTNLEIAEILVVSLSTVKAHVASRPR